MNESSSALLDKLENAMRAMLHWHRPAANSTGEASKPLIPGNQRPSDNVFRGNRAARRQFNKLATLANRRNLLRVEVTGEGPACQWPLIARRIRMAEAELKKQAEQEALIGKRLASGVKALSTPTPARSMGGI